MNNDTSSAFPLAHYFQPSYQASREALLSGLSALTRQHQVLIDSRSVSALTGQRGPSGETLAIDFCLIGARNPQHVTMVSCGTHGLEGYTGSAVQHYMLSQILPALKLPAGHAVVLLHGMNPYGFAWGRRVTENNVDLNRNFVSHYDTSLCNADYETLYAQVNPSQWSEESEAQVTASLQQFLAEHGMRRLQTALSAGQYKYPQGVQYGGNKPEASNVLLSALFREHLSQTESLTWLDFHTGLGAFAACELITGALKDTPEYLLSNKVWPQGVKSAQSGESISAELNGLLDRGLIALLPPSCRVAFAFPEYGTYEQSRVLGSLRADNWLYHHGARNDLNNPLTVALRKDCMEMFRPDSREWEHRIVEHGAGLVRQALHHALGSHHVPSGS